MDGVVSYDEFWRLVRVGAENECWPWLGYVDPRGYGYTHLPRGHRPMGQSRTIPTHRLSYFIAHGSLTTAMPLDHVCHTKDTTCVGGPACLHRRCVNPRHLETVTPSESSLRRSRTRGIAVRGCKAGLHSAPLGARKCTPCQLAASREWKRRNAARNLEWMRQWRKENRAHINEYKRARTRAGLPS